MFKKLNQTALFLYASMFIYTLLGLSLLFLPKEVLAYLNLSIGEFYALLLQVTGSLYLGLAFLNYYARKHGLTGPFLRPVIATNLCHIVIASLTLLRSIEKLENDTTNIIGLLCLSYLLIGLMNIRLMFKPPESNQHV